METSFSVKDIPLEQIDIGERTRVDYNKIPELAHDIRTYGLLNPLTVINKENANTELIKEQLDENLPFLLLAGGRRLAALQRNNAKTAPCRIVDRTLKEDEIKIIELHENLYRENLTWQEDVRLKKEIHELQVKLKGATIQRRKGEEGHKLEDTAEMLGVSTPTISTDIKLAKFAEESPEILQEGTKRDALRRFDKIRQDEARAELAKRLREEPDLSRVLDSEELGVRETESDGEEIEEDTTPQERVLKKKLCDSYKVQDFFEASSKIQSGVFDLVELDPPYAIEMQDGIRNRKNTEHYNEVSKKNYPDFMKKTLAECHRLMKNDSWIIVWFSIDPWYTDMLKWLQDAGFKVVKTPAIWVKRGGQTQKPQYTLGYAYDSFFFARKGFAEINKQGYSNIFHDKPIKPEHKIHPTERPTLLLDQIFKTFVPEGSSILVPFAGSGNSLLSAANCGMTSVGFDLSQEYKDAFDIRVYTKPYGDYYGMLEDTGGKKE